MNTFEVFSPSLEEEIEGIWLALEAAYEEHGIRCDDGHWMTVEEFSQLSTPEVVRLFNLTYNKTISLEELEAANGTRLCQ